jgi:hypothetical protein
MTRLRLQHFPDVTIRQRSVAQENSAHAALLDVSRRASRIAYLGSSGAAFLQSGIRGWAVEAPDSDPRLAPHRHLPESVVQEDEWRKLSPDWFRDRLARGLDAVLIERGGPLDRRDVVGWGIAAGLSVSPEPPAGYILLLRRP